MTNHKPEPAGWVFEATVAEIERRPFCDIQLRQLDFLGELK